jgi:hypothetical protein
MRLKTIFTLIILAAPCLGIAGEQALAIGRRGTDLLVLYSKHLEQVDHNTLETKQKLSIPITDDSLDTFKALRIFLLSTDGEFLVGYNPQEMIGMSWKVSDKAIQLCGIFRLKNTKAEDFSPPSPLRGFAMKDDQPRFKRWNGDSLLPSSDARFWCVSLLTCATIEKKLILTGENAGYHFSPTNADTVFFWDDSIALRGKCEFWRARKGTEERKWNLDGAFVDLATYKNTIFVVCTQEQDIDRNVSIISLIDDRSWEKRKQLSFQGRAEQILASNDKLYLVSNDSGYRASIFSLKDEAFTLENARLTPESKKHIGYGERGLRSSDFAPFDDEFIFLKDGELINMKFEKPRKSRVREACNP